MSRSMKITSMILENFKPLYLSGIKRFDYTIDQLIQLILGTNGSGKSSLLRMLTPDAPDQKEFDVDGYKKITIEAEKGEYVLEHRFGSSNTHSFKLNGLELNDGKTVTVFKELVKREFDYDSSLHKLLTGTIGFCQMSAVSRKELLYKLCDIELDYALGVFDKAKANHRDIAGVLKHLKAKIDPMVLRSMREDQVSALMEEALGLEGEITKIMPKTNQSVKDSNIFKRAVGVLLEKINHTTDELNTVLEDDDPLLLLSQRDTLSETLEVLRVKQSINENELTETNKAISELDTISDSLEGLDANFTLEDCDKEIGNLKSELLALNDFPSNEIGDLDKALLHLHEAYEEYNNTIAMNALTLTIFTPEEIRATRSNISELRVKLETSKSRESKQSEVIHHAELARAGDVNCGKCGHLNLSSSSVAPEILEVMRLKLTDLRTTIEETEGKLRELEATEVDIVDYEKAHFTLRGLINDRPSVQHVLGEFSLDTLLCSPRIVLSALLKMLTDVKMAKDLKVSESRLARLIKVRDSILVSSIGFDSTKIAFYEDKFESLLEESKHLKLALKNSTLQLKRLEKIALYSKTLLRLCDELIVSTGNYLESVGQSVANKRLSDITVKLALIRNQLNMNEVIKSNIADLIRDQEELTIKRERYENLLRALSPNRGIIADAISSVLIKFTRDINATISRVWEYELELKPFENQRNLNYKFPLQTDTNKVIDISLGSKGQQDIINLAVTLNAMHYLKLTEYPLFLDEVGSSFDFIHRQNFVKLIRELTTSGHCSQIFCVNHFTSDYGGISNADVIVLSPDNVIVPDTYNQNVQIA